MNKVRLLPICLVLTEIARAAQTENPRLEQIIQAYASNQQFMGSVLVAKDTTIVTVPPT